MVLTGAPRQHRTGTSDRRAATRSRRQRRAACAGIFLLLACVYLLSTGGHVYSVDEETMLATSRALAHGRRQVELTPANRSILQVVPHRSGEEVSKYGIGTSAVAAAPLAVGTAVVDVVQPARPELVVRLFVLMTNPLLTAATGVALLLLCLELGASLRGALLLALGYGLGTCAWSHAKTLFSEPAVALLLTLSVWLAVAAVRRRDRTGLLLWSGVCAGLALLFRISSIVYVAPLLGYVVLAGRPRGEALIRRVVSVGAGLAVTGALVGAVNWWRFGGPLALGYPHERYTTPWYEGTFGQLLSPGKGLVFYAPITALAIAVPFVVRARRAELGLLYGVFLVDLALFCRFSNWDGGASWGPRYLEPVLPLLVATLAPLVDLTRWRRWIAGLAVLGGALTLLAGVATYFVAIGWRDTPRLQAEVHATDSSGQDAMIRATDWVPHDSPIVLGLRYLPEAVRHTFSRIGGPAHPLPASPDGFLHFYDSPLQLDPWWAWWLPSGGWAPLLALAPLELAGAVIGARRLRVVWVRAGA